MAQRLQVEQLAFAACLFLDICACLQPEVLAASAADHRLVLTAPAWIAMAYLTLASPVWCAAALMKKTLILISKP